MSEHRDTNVGSGMVPHRKTCQCDECTVDRLQAENESLRSRLAETTLENVEVFRRLHDAEARLVGAEALLDRTLPDLRWARSAAASEWDETLNDEDIIEDIETFRAGGKP